MKYSRFKKQTNQKHTKPTKTNQPRVVFWVFLSLHSVVTFFKNKIITTVKFWEHLYASSEKPRDWTTKYNSIIFSRIWQCLKFKRMNQILINGVSIFSG